MAAWSRGNGTHLDWLRKSCDISTCDLSPDGNPEKYGRPMKSATVKSRLSERQLSKTTGLFEDDGQSRLFSLLSIAIKLPIIRISIIGKTQFFEVIRRSR